MQIYAVSGKFIKAINNENIISKPLSMQLGLGGLKKLQGRVVYVSDHCEDDHGVPQSTLFYNSSYNQTDKPRDKLTHQCFSWSDVVYNNSLTDRYVKLPWSADIF